LRLLIIAKCNEGTGGSARGVGGFRLAAMSGGVAARCARQMLNLIPEALRVRAATWSSALIVSWLPPGHFALGRRHNRRERELGRFTLNAQACRRIGVHVLLCAPWPLLVHLLQAVAEGTPRMLADDPELHASTLLAHPEAQPLDASLTIFAFRAGTAAQGSAR
jgi:Type II secretion system (T2SS), protein M subtype b